MAKTSPCPSPSKYQGLPWETWTNAFGQTSIIEEKLPEPPKLSKENKSGVMRLKHDDMKTFGLCPEVDPFTLVVCETCNLIIQPQALHHHYEMRHSNNKAHPPQILSEVAVPDKSSTKVVKASAKSSTPKGKLKKVSNKSVSKSKKGAVISSHSLPVSLALESSISNAATSKGEPLQPVVALTQIPGASSPILTAPPVLSKPSAPPPPPADVPPVIKARRAPRNQAPIKVREYDPDKHCGVVTTETMKPCTWSLTCKYHPMSLRRAVKGRCKPFDQLLSEHRQAKEAMLKEKKNLAAQSISSTLPPPPPPPPTQIVISEEKRMVKPQEIFEIPPIEEKISSPIMAPEHKLELTTGKQVYLSSAHSSLLIKGPERPSAPIQPASVQTEETSFTLNQPRSLSVSHMFSNHKIGGLVYSSRRMLAARQGLESYLHRAGNGYNKLYSTGLPIRGMPSTLSNVLNNMTFQGVKRKLDNPNKSNKKIRHSKEVSTSLLKIPLLKSY